MTTKVVNAITETKKVRAALDAGTYVFCGRGSAFGNKYHIGQDGDRDEVIRRHKEDTLADPAFVAQIKSELTNKVLGCFCKPKACHCDTYVEICDG